MVLDVVGHKIGDENNCMPTTAPFSVDEFWTAIFQMHHDKAFGLDGLNLAFYHRFWNLFRGDTNYAGLYSLVGWRWVA